MTNPPTANESAMKMARQYAIVLGEASRWKVLSRNPSYHGGTLGTIAIITRQEIVLGIMGAVFGAEVLSVMLQVSWFKYTKKKYGEGRRILKMAPLHHHFEKSGWTETQVVIRFWIITMLLCLVGLATLKLR